MYSAFYISGDKLVIVSPDLTPRSVLASYYEVVEARGLYSVRVSYFDTDGRMMLSTYLFTGAYSDAIDYLIAQYDSVSPIT